MAEDKTLSNDIQTEEQQTNIKKDEEIKKTEKEVRQAKLKEEEEKELEAIKDAIKEQAREDENPQASSFTLRKILGGDFLTAATIRRQIGVILLVVVFTMIYVSNRYSCQKKMLEIDQLNKELQDAKYKALSSASELTEQCRESNVLKMLHSRKDSVLKIASQPPYIINVPEK